MRIWLMAARPRTLPAAIAPVFVGTAAAVVLGGELPRAGAFVAALVGSIFIQIGTNLANDYSDAKRGADTADRLGPVRVTSAGLVTPRRVLNATWIAFAVAVACGIYLATVAGLVILVIGAFSIAAGVLYTGGPRPYGYAGLGEVFVFLFFGLVAVNGSYYVQVEELDALPLGPLDRGRLPGDGDPRRQQRPRHRDRPPRRQDDAGGADGPRTTRSSSTAAWSLGAFVVLPIALVAGEASAAAADRTARAAAGDRPDAGDDQPHRRPVAERRPRRHRRPARRLQPAGLRRAAARQLSRLAGCGMRLASVEVIPYALPFREPYVTARGTARPARDGAAAAAGRGGPGRARRSGAALAARRRRRWRRWSPSSRAWPGLVLAARSSRDVGEAAQLRRRSSSRRRRAARR